MKIEQLLPNRIVEDMPAAVYHAVDALGSSTLRKVLSASPAHAMAALRNREETASQRLGTALHAALLEPANVRGSIGSVGKTTVAARNDGLVVTATLAAANTDDKPDPSLNASNAKESLGGQKYGVAASGSVRREADLPK
jgi:hypothetical protein